MLDPRVRGWDLAVVVVFQRMWQSFSSLSFIICRPIPLLVQLPANASWEEAWNGSSTKAPTMDVRDLDEVVGTWF